MNELELEVFRADEKASRGITSADIAATAAAYDPAKNPAHICIGHPKSDTPAYGVIAGLRAEGSRLFATLKDVGEKVIKGVKDGTLVNRSFAFFSRDHESNPVPGVLYPRHLGFLGASAPGIPGLTNIKKALTFNADDDTFDVDGAPAPAVLFEAAVEPTPTFTVTEESNVADDKTAEDLRKEREALDRERAEFAAERDSARKAGNKALVDGLVTAGKVLPANADKLALIFDALDAEPLEFEAGKDKRPAASELAALLGEGPRLVDVDGKPLSPSKEFDAKGDKPKTAGEITAAANALVKDEPGLTFEAAVERVTGQQSEAE
jgi:hypothetical protein